jgi:hypothetical protein
MVARVWPVAVTIIIAVDALAAPKNAEPGVGTGAAEARATARAAAEELLDRPIDVIRLNEVSFASALAQMAEITGLELSPKWDLLAKAGVRKDARVSGRMRGMAARKAITTILDAAGGGSVRLAHFLSADGTVIITTYADYAAIHQFAKRYDVKDFIDRWRGAGKGEREAAAALMKLVRETVDPTGWTEAGGNFTIKYEQGQLVVSALAESHSGIESLLAQLRGARRDGAK